MFKLFSKVKRLALDLLLPIECLNCSLEGEYFCDTCKKELKTNKREESSKFSKNLLRDNIDLIFIAGDYDDALLQNLIIKYKYNFIAPLGDVLGGLLVSFWKDNEFEKFSDIKNTILIPLPLSKKRLRWRGFNQAEILAQTMANEFSYKLSTALKRSHRAPQAELDEKSRLKNIKNTFSWKGDSLNNKTIILIDDVVTTGATINEAAYVLKQAGAERIWALTLAKG